MTPNPKSIFNQLRNGYHPRIAVTEIKKDNHPDLWRAIREQLIERYTRDLGADGFGIYQVFWFGDKNIPLHDGKKPRSAVELEQQLHKMLPWEEARHIEVCVVDCALP